MKNKLVIFLICIMMLGVHAWAAEFEYTSDEADNISISGQTDPQGRVSLRVVFLGDSNEPIDITHELLDENPSVLNYIDQTAADEDGNFNISFGIDGTRGYYMIHLQDETKDLGYEILYHFTEEDVAEAVQTLEEYAKTKSEEETVEYLDSNHLICRITDSEYEALKSGGYLPMLINVIKNAESLDGASGLRVYIDQSVFLKDFYSASDARQKNDIIVQNSGLLNLDALDNYTILYNEVYDDSQRQKIIDDFSKEEYYVLEDFVQAFENEIIFGGVEYTKWTAVQKIVEINKNIFNSSDYNKYSTLAADRNTKATNIIKEITGKRFESTEELSEAFSEAVKKYTSSTANNGNGGGGGGGGGGGSGNQISILPTTPNGQDDKGQDIDEDNTPGDDTQAEDKPVFNDLDSVSWAKESITRLYNSGVISGRGEGIFAPGDNVTREEFLTMLIKGMKIELKSGSSEFEDVEDTAWYAPYVITAFENGIVSGISDTEFGAGTNITRQDMAVMSARAAEHMGRLPEPESGKADFKDNDDISAYAKASVKKLYDLGIISGMDDGNFLPLSMCTRAEAAVIIDKLVSLTE